MNKLKEANANSFPAQRWLFEVYETPYKEMSYGVKTVAGVIALCAWGEKDTAFPSYKSISVALGGASEETISNAVDKLIAMGFLSVSKVKTKAGDRNDYRLVFPNTMDTNTSDTNTSDTSENTSDTVVIEEANTSDTGTNTSDTGVNTSDTRTNHFGYEDQSLHTGVVEALNEASIQPPTEASIETPTERTEGGIKEGIKEEGTPSSLDSEASDARDEHTYQRKTKVKNLIKEVVKEHPSSSDWKPSKCESDYFPDIKKEAEGRYRYLISKGMKADQSFGDVDNWFIDWVKDNEDNLNKTIFLMLNFQEKISDLTTYRYFEKRQKLDAVFDDYEDRAGWIRGQHHYTDVLEVITKRQKRLGRKVVLL